MNSRFTFSQALKISLPVFLIAYSFRSSLSTVAPRFLDLNGVRWDPASSMDLIIAEFLLSMAFAMVPLCLFAVLQLGNVSGKVKTGFALGMLLLGMVAAFLLRVQMLNTSFADPASPRWSDLSQAKFGEWTLGGLFVAGLMSMLTFRFIWPDLVES